jgi:hypothetical protein
MSEPSETVNNFHIVEKRTDGRKTDKWKENGQTEEKIVNKF